MLNNIIIWLLTLLLGSFPSWGEDNMYLHLLRTNHTDIAAPKIISAFESRDIAALEALMCQNIKDNVEDLQEKIGEMMDAIEGEITESSWKIIGSYHERRRDGRRITQSDLDIYLTTSSVDYKLLIVWETANNFAVEEVGIRAIVLLIPKGSTLADIRATEGVGSWHD